MSAQHVPGSYELWTLPDGRTLFYPLPGHARGYLVESPGQARSIRWTLRALFVIAYVAVAVVVVEASVLTVAAAVTGVVGSAGLATWLLVRRMRPVDEPLPFARRLQLSSAFYSTGWSLFAGLACGVLAVLAIRHGIVYRDLATGIAGGLVFGGNAYFWLCLWHYRRSTRI